MRWRIVMKRRNQELQRHWRIVLDEYVASGISMERYCQERHVSKASM